jgi:polar amino acid transport system substrate-binding protein
MKRLKSTMVFLLILSFVAFSAAAAPPQKTIRIAAGEWPPYISKKLPHKGLAAHLIIEAFLISKINVEFEFFTWRRAFDQVKAGRIEATPLWRKTEARTQFFYFSDTVIETNVVFFHKKDFPFSWEKIEDLKGLSVGISDSYNQQEEFTQASINGLFHTQIAESDVINIRKLINNRTNIFPMEKRVGQSLLISDFSLQQRQLITYHKKPLATNQNRILFSKKVPNMLEVLRLFNEGLAQLKKRGRYQSILNDFKAGRYNTTKKQK